MSVIRLTPEPLTRAAFSEFGDVIETADRQALEINYGQTQRFDDLAKIDVAEQAGTPVLSIFRSKPITLPFQARRMEYHPLGSQSFMPLHSRPFLILVAPPAQDLDPGTIRAFLSDGRQGVSYHPGTWHHFQLSLVVECDYLVIDRGGPGDNCVELDLETEVWIEA